MNSNKWYTIIKIGYSVGVYGCSGEYFTVVWYDGETPNSQSFYGMYGAEERIGHIFKDAGYSEKYTQSFYGRMTRKDLTKNCVSEYQVIEMLKPIIK